MEGKDVVGFVTWAVTIILGGGVVYSISRIRSLKFEVKTDYQVLAIAWRDPRNFKKQASSGEV